MNPSLHDLYYMRHNLRIARLHELLFYSSISVQQKFVVLRRLRVIFAEREVKTQIGKELRDIGTVYGVMARRGETDDSLRARIIKVIAFGKDRSGQ